MIMTEKMGERRGGRRNSGGKRRRKIKEGVEGGKELTLSTLHISWRGMRASRRGRREGREGERS